MDILIEQFVKENHISCIFLSIIGGDRYGFEKEEAQIILNYLKDEIIPIVGIDVYIRKDNELHLPLSYNNWYCERNDCESFSDYSHRSNIEAISFINNYNSANGIPIFDIYCFHLKNGE